MNHYPHIPVLLSTVLSVLDPLPGETVLDVTLGLGGHASAFLERIGPKGSLFGIDADHENLSRARERLSHQSGTVTLFQGNFRDIASFNLPPLHVLFADLGLSSPHLDDPARGFSFREDAPLDLRFDQSRGVSAAEWLHAASLRQVTQCLRDYGELRDARRIAEALLLHPMLRTIDVRGAVEKVCGWRAPSILPQVFQALRIAVNDELGALDALLQIGPSLLVPGGRMGILSYHSLEDRRVKTTFRSLTTPAIDDATGAVKVAAPFLLMTRKALVPSEEEVSENPRARSVKFRAIRRTSSSLPLP